MGNVNNRTLQIVRSSMVESPDIQSDNAYLNAELFAELFGDVEARLVRVGVNIGAAEMYRLVTVRPCDSVPKGRESGTLAIGDRLTRRLGLDSEPCEVVMVWRD